MADFTSSPEYQTQRSGMMWKSVKTAVFAAVAVAAVATGAAALAGSMTAILGVGWLAKTVGVGLLGTGVMAAIGAWKSGIDERASLEEMNASMVASKLAERGVAVQPQIEHEYTQNQRNDGQSWVQATGRGQDQAQTQVQPVP